MNNENIYCDHCHADVDSVNRHGLCEDCADECAREWAADLAYDESRGN